MNVSLPLRQILRSSPSASCCLVEVLEAICTAELLQPSNCLWLVSPNIGNSPILDNRSGGFSSLQPNWAQRLIFLSEFLLQLLRLDCRVVLATIAHPDESSSRFLAELRDQATEAGSPNLLRVVTCSQLGRQGILGDGYLLSGCLSFNGTLSQIDEVVSFDIRPETLAEAHAAFRVQYGEIQ